MNPEAGVGVIPSTRIVRMTTKEIATKLVELCSVGKFHEALESLYSPAIVSVEASAPPGGSREATGIDAVRGKGQWWQENHEVHSAKVEGPLVAGDIFAVAFIMDVTFKPASKRHTMEEIAVYHCADGKIVREEFFYKM